MSVTWKYFLNEVPVIKIKKNHSFLSFSCLNQAYTILSALVKFLSKFPSLECAYEEWKETPFKLDKKKKKIRMSKDRKKAKILLQLTTGINHQSNTPRTSLYKFPESVPTTKNSKTLMWIKQEKAHPPQTCQGGIVAQLLDRELQQPAMKSGRSIFFSQIPLYCKSQQPPTSLTKPLTFCLHAILRSSPPFTLFRELQHKLPTPKLSRYLTK